MLSKGAQIKRSTLCQPSSDVHRLCRKMRGFSVVELMVSIAVGLVVMAGVLGIVSNTIKSNYDTLGMAKLNQELRGLMDLMTRDLRRAGFWGTATSAIGPGTANVNPFGVITSSNYGGESANSCIAYSYDTGGDGAVSGNDDLYGFRLRTQAVEARKNGAACSANGWANITDENIIEITGLQFTLTNRDVDIDGPADDHIIRVPEVEISLTGRLKRDTSVTRNITEIVRVRTNTWVDPP